MKSKILLKQGLSVIACIGLVLLSASFLPSLWELLMWKEAPAIIANAVIPQEQAIFGLPVRLKIPSINVDAAIEQVGLTPQGAMDVPKGPGDAAWFDRGPRPGEKGSSVIAGHYGWKNQIPAVFDNLHELQKGDKIFVEDEKGEIVTFVVREIRKYDPKADASAVFNSNDGKAHLNLVTCDGAWNKVSESRPNRLVVFADKEDVSF